MKGLFLIQLIAILSLISAKESFRNEEEISYPEKLKKFVNFLDVDSDYGKMVNVISNQGDNWQDITDYVKNIISKYRSSKKGEEKIEDKSINFCEKTMELDEKAIEICKAFVNDLHSCMLNFPKCLGKIIPSS